MLDLLWWTISTPFKKLKQLFAAEERPRALTEEEFQAQLQEWTALTSI